MLRLMALLALLSSILTFAASENIPATLEVLGEPLFVFRMRIGSVQPSDRVRLITERISQIQSDRSFDLNEIKARNEGEIGWEVFAGEKLLLLITPDDARLEGRPARLIAEGLAMRIREILSADRIAKSPAVLLRNSLYAAGYLLGFFLILWGISRLFRRLRALAGEGEATRLGPLRIKGLEVLTADRISSSALGILRILQLVVTASLLYLFVPLELSLFPWTAKLSPVLIGYVMAPLHQIWRGVVGFVPNLFFIALNVLVARYLLKFVHFLFLEIEKGNLRFSGFYPEWALPTYHLVRILAIAFTLIIIFPYIPGSTSPAFQGVSVFLGILVSLGSTSAVANAVAGIVITYMRSFRPGDRVQIADTVGDIIERTLLVTRVRTVKNVDITIPNSLVLNNHIVNYSVLAPTDGLILHTEVTIGYDAPWKKVHELLIEAALATEHILATPAPFVLQVALEDSYVRYQLNAYTRHANHMSNIYSGLHARVQDAFNAAGVEILSPAYQALRDGNTITIPAGKRPNGYQAPSFRVTQPDARPT